MKEGWKLHPSYYPIFKIWGISLLKVYQSLNTLYATMWIKFSIALLPLIFKYLSLQPAFCVRTLLHVACITNWCNLTPLVTYVQVNNICEAVPRPLTWAPNGLNELPEMCFEFRFILIGKPTMASFKRPIIACTQILVQQLRAQNKDFGAVSQTDFTRV